MMAVKMRLPGISPGIYPMKVVLATVDPHLNEQRVPSVPVLGPQYSPFEPKRGTVEDLSYLFPTEISAAKALRGERLKTRDIAERAHGNINTIAHALYRLFLRGWVRSYRVKGTKGNGPKIMWELTEACQL